MERVEHRHHRDEKRIKGIARKPKEKRPFGRPICSSEDNIEMDLKEGQWKCRWD
jgi:hypothetical protein